MADTMMNCGYFHRSLSKYLRDIVFPDLTMRFLISMRKASFYSHQNGLKNKVLAYYYKSRQKKLGIKMGWSISADSLGYGLLLPHWGTIVVGQNNIGNYAVLHTSTCISGNMKTIGDALYVATGAKMTAKVVLGDNVTVGANAVVTKSYPDGNVLLGGIPASVIKKSEPWYIRDGEEYYSKVRKIESLKQKLNIY